MANGLRPKQQAFADYYIELGNAEQAAIKAGYSEKYARGNAHKLVASSGIQEYIDKRLAEISSKRIANAQEVMETLTRILRREDKENVVVTLKTHRSFYDENGKKGIEDTETPTLVEIPTRICDVNKAAELLGKRYGIYTENLQIGDTPKVVDDI